MDDDIQQLLDLRLEMMCFRLAHKANSINNAAEDVKRLSSQSEFQAQFINRCFPSAHVRSKITICSSASNTCCCFVRIASPLELLLEVSQSLFIRT